MPSPEAAGLPALPPLREVIARHGLDARKSLGQHFLLDGNLTDRIARQADPLDAGTVFEIGPGPGGLTRSLLRGGAARLVAIERDARCIAALRELEATFPGRLELVEADALTVDLARLGEAPRQIVANLPYNVSTPLLLRWLAQARAFSSMTLMFQKEVAERLRARPRTPDYGRLSVITQFHCTVKALFDIPAAAFTPPPKVVSTVVRLVPRPAPLAAIDPADLERVTAAAFGQRRKMLRASLRGLGGPAEEILGAAGVPPTARAEEIDVEGFCALAAAWRARLS